MAEVNGGKSNVLRMAPLNLVNSWEVRVRPLGIGGWLQKRGRLGEGRKSERKRGMGREGERRKERARTLPFPSLPLPFLCHFLFVPPLSPSTLTCSIPFFPPLPHLRGKSPTPKGITPISQELIRFREAILNTLDLPPWRRWKRL